MGSLVYTHTCERMETERIKKRETEKETQRGRKREKSISILRDSRRVERKI